MWITSLFVQISACDDKRSLFWRITNRLFEEIETKRLHSVLHIAHSSSSFRWLSAKIEKKILKWRSVFHYGAERRMENEGKLMMCRHQINSSSTVRIKASKIAWLASSGLKIVSLSKSTKGDQRRGRADRDFVDSGRVKATARKMIVRIFSKLCFEFSNDTNTEDKKRSVRNNPDVRLDATRRVSCVCFRDYGDAC